MIGIKIEKKSIAVDIIYYTVRRQRGHYNNIVFKTWVLLYSPLIPPTTIGVPTVYYIRYCRSYITICNNMYHGGRMLALMMVVSILLRYYCFHYLKYQSE